MKFKRIHIFGGAGSGKTTLAKTYCRMHNIPHFELDVPEFTRHVRVIKRHFQLLKKAEPGSYPTFFPTLFELIKLNHEYASGPLKDTVKLLSNFEEKVSICRSYEYAAMEIGV